MPRKFLSAALVSAFVLVAPQACLAGPYADDLSKCFVSQSSSADKQGLVQWMFFAISLNPDAAPFANISDQQRETADVGIARFFERLLTESCLLEARQAMRYEGQGALAQSFKLLGEVATTEMFTNAEVSAGVESFTKHLDSERLKKAFDPDAAASRP